MMSVSDPILGNTTKLPSSADFVGQYGYTALRFYLLEIARSIIPEERIKVCWRYPLPERQAIEIIYSDELKRARSAGTMKCGSGWVCPACMAHIQERRRLELQTALDRSSDKYFSVMVTYTAAHTQQMRLAQIMRDMQDAYTKLHSGRFWQNVKSEYMIGGMIRATEITYGASGWHPHFHEIVLIDRTMLDENIAGSVDEYSQSLQTQLGTEWLRQLSAVGLSGKQGVALDVRGSNRDVADYVSKFGHMPQNVSMHVKPDEVAYSIGKTAGGGNFGVLDILFAAASDSKYRTLFREYHVATKGRSQLKWSKGLKSLLDIEIIRDEIAAQGIETETDRIMAQIDLDTWRYIAYNNHTGQLMTYANAGDDVKVSWFIERIQEKMSEANNGVHWSLGH